MCNTCAELGFQCVYRRPAAANQSAPAQPNTSPLENRLAMVETLLQALVSGGSRPADEMSELLAADWDRDRPPMGSEAPHQAQPSINSGHDDTVDGMAVITFADEANSGYFGPSSNSAFFSHIARALESNNNSAMHRDGVPRDITTSMSRPASPPLPARPAIHDNINLYILPSRQETSRLIEIFFTVTGSFFPYIHRKAVLNMIEDLDDAGQRGVPKSRICLINALLAIGTSLDDNQDRPLRLREMESDVFFQRALNLSPWTMSNSMNLESRKCQGSLFPLGAVDKLTQRRSSGTLCHDPISARNIPVGTDVADSWAPRASRPPDGGPHPRSGAKPVAPNTRDTHQDMVYLHRGRQVCCGVQLLEGSLSDWQQDVEHDFRAPASDSQRLYQAGATERRGTRRPAGRMRWLHRARESVPRLVGSAIHRKHVMDPSSDTGIDSWLTEGIAEISTTSNSTSSATSTITTSRQHTPTDLTSW